MLNFLRNCQITSFLKSEKFLILEYKHAIYRKEKIKERKLANEKYDSTARNPTSQLEIPFLPFCEENSPKLS